jgi:hypothetical protein
VRPHRRQGNWVAFSSHDEVTPPKLIATVRLHGSASTWMFNVVRELMIAAAGKDRVAAFYAENSKIWS